MRIYFEGYLIHVWQSESWILLCSWFSCFWFCFCFFVFFSSSFYFCDFHFHLWFWSLNFIKYAHLWIRDHFLHLILFLFYYVCLFPFCHLIQCSRFSQCSLSIRIIFPSFFCFVLRISVFSVRFIICMPKHIHSYVLHMNENFYSIYSDHIFLASIF